MATQVTYKGSTIANFTNTTKTLKTSGKYMEGDVAVTESITLQTKTATPTETAQTISADSGYEGLSKVTVNAISSTYVGTGIARKSSADTTFASATGTFTAPIGYYSAAATKTITTKAAATVYPSTANQTIASYQWLTGNQTIAAVTTANLSAANIVSGVTVKVGDASNASRIAQVTGTYSGIIPTGTLSVTAAGSQINVAAYQYASVRTGATTTPATTITKNPTMTFDASTGTVTAAYTGTSNVTPTVGTSGWISGGNATAGTITTTGTNTYTLTPKSAADLTVDGATVTAASGYYSTATAKAVATTTHPNPTAAIASATGVVTATHVQGTGYVTGGTTTGTLNLTTQAAQTINTSTADQTIASNRWLTGTQTIKSVTTAGIASANIVSGVTIKVGDANNASRITQVTGTYSGIIPTGTATLTGANSQHNVAAYQYASVKAGTATTPATTITTNPTVTISNTTGIVTATYTGTSNVTPTVASGWVAAGTSGTITATGTKTLQLTSKAAATYNTSTADQTVAANQWLTGAQTIKSVTTANITASNIRSGITVKVGDANNASRITQVTGTLEEARTCYCYIYGTGNSSRCYIEYNGSKYYTDGQTFEFKQGTNDTKSIRIYAQGTSEATFYFGGARYWYGSTVVNDTHPLVGGDVEILLSYNAATPRIDYYLYNGPLTPCEGVVPEESTLIITPPDPGDFTFYGLNYVKINGISSTYVGTGIARKSSADVTFTSTNGTFTAPIGYYSAAATKTLTAQAAQTINTSTADQTIASYRWLTGTQTIKSVTTTNITAANIASGVTVKVGDANNASRILQITGTHAGGITPTGTISITAAGNTDVTNYATASVRTGTATTPATTITANITGTFRSSDARLTLTATGSSSITPTVASGWIAAGTAGTISVSGSSQWTEWLATQAAQTINTSTADQTIASYRWLTGTQTIKSVTTANLTAANIAAGVTVKVGDANNASRISQVTGTFNALTIGASNPASVRIATGTTVGAIHTFQLPSGKWQVNIVVRFNSTSTTGRRYILASTTSTATTSPYEQTIAPVTGSYTFCNVNFAVDNTTTRSWYIRGFQNCGASMYVTPRINWIGVPY